MSINLDLSTAFGPSQTHFQSHWPTGRHSALQLFEVGDGVLSQPYHPGLHDRVCAETDWRWSILASRDLHPCHSILRRNPRPELRDVLREFTFECSLENDERFPLSMWTKWRDGEPQGSGPA
jgi:hypothetical protein